MGVAVDGVGSPRANLRVSALGVRADAERPGRVEIHCRVSFTAPAGHLDPAHVLLEIGAANARDAARPIPLATREIVMGPGEEAGVEIVLDDVPGSLLRARAIPSAPSDDALETDSLRWAEVPALRPARVSLSGTAGPALLAALAADPYIELLSPSYSSGASARTQEIPVRVVLGSLPTKIDAATLILAPPVDPERALAGIAELPAGVLKRERHTIWGELDPGSVVVDGGTALLPSATERSFLSTGGAVVGTVGTLDSFPLVRLGLDPEDPSLSESPLLPALLAGVVDHLAGRSDEIGVEHPAGAVDLRGAADPAIELLRLDSSAPPEEVAGRALHVERAGPYLLRRRSGASEVLIVVPPRDESESPASAHTELEPISVVAAERSPRRASLWWWLVLGLCCTCLLEHLLFVRRRLL